MKYIWFKEPVPANLTVKQVYGIAFSDDGNVLLRFDDKYKLTGGKPEKYDKDFSDTLKREYLEELNVLLEDIHYLGYLLISEKQEQYAQVRMIAKIKRVGVPRPDLDNGKIYKRFMANQKNVKEYLNYPDIAGKKLIEDAIALANKKYIFKKNKSQREYFI